MYQPRVYGKNQDEVRVKSIECAKSLWVTTDSVKREFFLLEGCLKEKISDSIILI